MEELRAEDADGVVTLRQAGEDVAVLAPIDDDKPKRTKRRSRRVDLEAFRSAVGGWADADVDELIANIYADRAASDRPPIEL